MQLTFDLEIPRFDPHNLDIRINSMIHNLVKLFYKDEITDNRYKHWRKRLDKIQMRIKNE